MTECAFCNERATQFKDTDWGERHICDRCAAQVKISTPQETIDDWSEDRFKTAAKRFLRDLGYVPGDQRQPPNNPR